MEWAKKDDGWRVPVKCWAGMIEQQAIDQAAMLAKMPCVFKHIALMPDCHLGYAIPIGGVVALKNAVSPYGVGNDCSCGMHSVETDLDADVLSDMSVRREFHTRVKKLIPVGMSVHDKPQEWDGFEEYLDNGGCPEFCSDRIRKSLGTEGQGNHFVELQKCVWAENRAENKIWMMIHSGSRNLGAQLAKKYHELAVSLCKRWYTELPSEEYAFIPVDDINGQNYIRDMHFAMKYALESRTRMMKAMVQVLTEMFPSAKVVWEYDINHNFARLENHFGENVWVHRKGATSAKKGEIGIIPGSMGTSSYIVEGLGNEESFCSCSHGAGRRMSRSDATIRLTVEECDNAMSGIVCDRWSKARSRGDKNKFEGKYDLSEAPGAYKDIDDVIANEFDLVKPIVKLAPLANIKG